MFGRKLDPFDGMVQLAVSCCAASAKRLRATQDAISSGAFLSARIALQARHYPVPAVRLERFIEAVWPAFLPMLEGSPHIGAFATSFVQAKRYWQAEEQTDAIQPFYDWRQELLPWSIDRNLYFALMSALLDGLDTVWMQEQKRWRW